MHKTAILVAAVCLFGSTAASATPTLLLPESLSRISPAEFAQRTIAEVAQQGQVVTLSTRRASSREGPSREAFVDDAHARAVIDLKADRVSFQVWHQFEYDGKLNEIAAIRYSIDGTPYSAAPLAFDQWPSNCSADSGSCYRANRVGFELPAEHLQTLAASPSPHSRAPWSVRFEDHAGNHVTIGFAPAELAGLALAYEGWQAARK